MDKNKFEKLLAELDTEDFDDLGRDDSHGTTVNDERWSVYRQITTALLDAMDRNDHILKVHYLSKPNPEEEFASVMVVMSQVVGLDKEVKAAFAQAATLCDIVSTLENRYLPIFKQRQSRCGQRLCADYEV